MLNTATPGQRIVTDSGTAWNIYQDTKHDDSDGNSYAYNPGASPSSFSLTTARLQGNTAPAGSGTTLGTLNISSLAQRATGSGSLYRPSTSPTSTYLIETDPRFASYRQWLSSDYMLKALALDPATTQKRLGDGFYEQRLLTEQVAQLTGRRFLAGYQNEEDQYRALMTAGITFAKEWQLIPGVALTPEQMARLTTDMVWLVEKEVTLADGSKQKALVPQLYARVREGDLLPAGGLLADRTLDLNVSGNLTNLGTLAGRQLVSLTAENLQNLGGRITGEDIWLTARQDLQNPGGTLKLAAAGDIKLLAAQLQSAGTTDIQAGNNLTLGTVTTAYANSVGNGKNSRQESGSREVGTTIASKGNLTLQASNNLTARASDVTSTEGKLLATAGNDLRIEAGESTLNVAEQHKTTSKGFLSKKTTTTRDTLNDIDAVASTLSGDSVTLIANRDIGVKGSNVVATNDTTAIATRNLIIEAATETHNETHVSKTKQSGAFSSGTGFTIGSKQQSTNQKTDATRVAKSTVGSTDGNVLLLAGETYKQVGSDVVALKGNIDIAAKQVDIVEARETSRTVTEQKSKQSGLTLAVSSPVITAVQTAQQMSQAAADTKDGRMKALAAANVGLAASNAVDAVQGGQGPPLNDKPNQIQTGTNPDGSAITRDANAADQMGGINISLSIGSSKSSSKTTQTSNTAVASNLTAGRDISIEASGAGKDSDITLQGAKATAARNLTLAAEDEIRLLAAANTADQHSTNKNSSASLGVGFALGGQQNGFTIQAGVSGGKGKANGNDVTWSNTQVEAGNQLTLESGGDTTLKGATAKGEQVRAQIGGNLTIESLQDTSTYDSRQKSLGASVSLCIPPFCYGAASSGSISASASKIKSDYASVTEQSAIKAGDGGFQVDVKGDTGLKAGAITSTQKALDEKLNSFKTGGELTLSDIQNKADYSAKSASVNIGTGFSPTGALIPQGTSAGFGKDSGSASSTTQAAISGIAGNTAARTGDAETGIQKIFDQQKVQKEIDAQTQITQIFGQSAPKAAADFAKAQADDLKKQGNFDEAAKWEEGGVYRVALHTALGGLAGGTSGAFGAAAGATAAPFLNELQASIAKSLQDAGANDGAAKLVGQLISGATAAGIGAAVGSTQGATTAFNTDSNNRQLHPNQVKAIKDKAIELAGKDGLDAQQWEQRLTQQLLYQNDSTQASFGNDLVAESILKQVARSTGVDLDGRGQQVPCRQILGQRLMHLRPDRYITKSNLAAPLLAALNAHHLVRQIDLAALQHVGLAQTQAGIDNQDEHGKQGISAAQMQGAIFFIWPESGQRLDDLLFLPRVQPAIAGDIRLWLFAGSLDQPLIQLGVGAVTLRQ
jgi:filamentous hemagglutinin